MVTGHSLRKPLRLLSTYSHFLSVLFYQTSHYCGQPKIKPHYGLPQNLKLDYCYGFPQYLDWEKRCAHLLKICAETDSLSNGRSLHAHIHKSMETRPVFLSNSLVNMYAKCEALEDAEMVFDQIPERDTVSWNTMISGYIWCGLVLPALLMFKKMLSQGQPIPDRFTMTNLLKVCTGCNDLSQGSQVHALLIKYKLDQDIHVGSSLINFYCNLHQIHEALKVFDELELKDVVIMNTVIACHAQSGNCAQAFQIFRQIMSSPFSRPARASLVALLTAVGNSKTPKHGELIHGLIVKTGFRDEVMIENSLVRMYLRVGSMWDAFNITDDYQTQNVMAWTSLISGYADHGWFEEACELVYRLHHSGMAVDGSNLACVLGLCAESESLDMGVQVHSLVLRLGYGNDIDVQDSLVNMYAKCSSMYDAVRAFNEIQGGCDLLSWTTLLSGYVYCGFSVEALRTFSKMRDNGVKPDSVACVGVLAGCTSIQFINHGRQVHAYAVKCGYDLNIQVETALLSLYAECGRLDFAIELFSKMFEPDVVSWTALISAHVKLDHNQDALIWLVKMVREGTKPNKFTLASALTASAKLTAMETGKLIHAQIIKTGVQTDSFIASSLLDMYSKCGSLEKAVSCFEEAPKGDIVIWNSILAGQARHGNGEEVLGLFEKMKECGMKPDHVSFLSVLSGCSHGRLVDETMFWFRRMKVEYGINPKEEHYACVVDALGRAGMLNEAVKFAGSMPFGPELEVLRSLLSSCKTHACIALGLAVAARIMKLEPHDPATLVLLSNLYASHGRWEEAEWVREVIGKTWMMRKEAGQSWLQTKFS
ncbi:hypothetical protein AMTR_s00095p00039180 [Amborella trichopoda]|uniref:Pentacotripeptide-repeat region of PRORP domain-containing protein n=1 Tax=Amborella trichopoda TaxID=13333 RepID=W1NQN7_AMBTC|nr:hypothetical protein AMTR_s00095p00039180 [Amborella trichopoda]